MAELDPWASLNQADIGELRDIYDDVIYEVKVTEKPESKNDAKLYDIKVDRFDFEFYTNDKTTSLVLPHSLEPYAMGPGELLNTLSDIAFYRLPLSYAHKTIPEKESFENQAKADIHTRGGEIFTVDFDNHDFLSRYHFLLYNPAEIEEQVGFIRYELPDFKWSLGFPRDVSVQPKTIVTTPTSTPWSEGTIHTLLTLHSANPTGDEAIKIQKRLTPKLNELRQKPNPGETIHGRARMK